MIFKPQHLHGAADLMDDSDPIINIQLHVGLHEVLAFSEGAATST